MQSKYCWSYVYGKSIQVYVECVLNVLKALAVLDCQSKIIEGKSLKWICYKFSFSKEPGKGFCMSMRQVEMWYVLHAYFNFDVSIGSFIVRLTDV